MKLKFAISRVLLATAMMLCVTDARAHGHAFPESQSPRAGESLAASPAEIAIRFDSPIEQAFARLKVVDSAATNFARGPVQLSSDARSLSVQVAPLEPGDYSVVWGVVAADGHRTEGSYSFTVRPPGT